MPIMELKASDKLPHPATNADTYAYATVVELRRLNSNLEQLLAMVQPATAVESDTVELKEPEKPTPAHRDKKATGKGN